MSTEHRFDPYGEDRPQRQRSWLSTCLFGCLIAAVIGVVLAAIAAYWIARNWRDWTARVLSDGINQSIDESDLPPQEKEEIKVQVTRVADAFRNKKISNEQITVLFQELMESPILAAFVVQAAEEKYLDPSGLSDEEKAEARITIQRFTRGAVEGKIDQASVDAAVENIADPQENGGWQLRERVTDAEIRAFLAAAKAEADKANIPEEPMEFDPSDEIKRIIDNAMGEQLAEEPPADEPPAGGLPAEEPPAEEPPAEEPPAEEPPTNELPADESPAARGPAS
jgi:hypothetical protein